MIKFKRDGHLRCDLCNTIWCRHIEQLIRRHDDAEEIWRHYPEFQIVNVPIVPTANIWSEVKLESLTEGKKNYSLLAFSGKENSANPFFKDFAFIGFVHEGEGRMIFRDMLLDWFIGTHENEIAEEGCRAAGHGYHAQIRWNKDMEDESKKLVQQWTLFMTGKCLGCTYDPSSNSQFVPDVQITTPWNR